MDAVLVRPDPDPFAGEPVAAGYRAGDLVFLSSLAATGPDGRLVGAGDFDAQAEQVMRNLAAALAAAGSGLDRVLRIAIFLTDATHFPKLVALRRHWFAAPYPADTVVEVNGLRLPGALIEIEATALAGGRIEG